MNDARDIRNHNGSDAINMDNLGIHIGMMELSDEDMVTAMQNYIPLPREKVELGGDIYYKCHWLSCGATVTKYDKFCRNCGQRFTEEE